ncbi:MAG: hypothetical protein Athens101428_438 [Candidatus Berkelbacteria bacterium Athens1014_28]|uniref:G5 domain-containing protein n=1 Tax=Candidatus Berkelbacteria bacterium Athens1014_28 TaxID=2017145 RepID=A0A554LMC8_9BACT|nr:MAG: hypothetical protein Athens101428_438 [Candidatus Berkelbacteria bacterium Athens1014_28]
MRSFFYSVLLTSFFATGFFYVFNGHAADFEVVSTPKFPYQIDEISATGISTIYSGESPSFEASKIITDLGVAYFPEDKIKIFPDPKLKIGGKVTINRAPLISVKDGKRSASYRSWTTTVEELFTEKNIELGADDKTNVSLSAQIVDGSQIAITRVAKTTVVEPKPIDFKIVTKKNPNEEKDYKKIVQNGIKGIKNYFYLVIREDGEEVSRSLTKTEIAKEPTDQIVEVGTKVLVYGSGVASIWKSSGDMIAACNFVKRGTKVVVVNQNNGKSVTVTCAGGGLREDRIVDLSDSAFEKLGGTWGQGLLQNVRVEKYYPE